MVGHSASAGGVANGGWERTRNGEGADDAREGLRGKGNSHFIYENPRTDSRFRRGSRVSIHCVTSSGSQQRGSELGNRGIVDSAELQFTSDIKFRLVAAHLDVEVGPLEACEYLCASRTGEPQIKIR